MQGVRTLHAARCGALGGSWPIYCAHARRAPASLLPAAAPAKRMPSTPAAQRRVACRSTPGIAWLHAVETSGGSGKPYEPLDQAKFDAIVMLVRMDRGARVDGSPTVPCMQCDAAAQPLLFPCSHECKMYHSIPAALALIII